MEQTQTVESRALNAIRRGGEWFLSQQDRSFLHYTYDAYAHHWPDEHQSAREMAALWSITQLAKFLGDPRYLRLAQRGFAHFEKQFRSDPQHGFIVVALTQEQIKLSYNAFLILALADMNHEKMRPYLAGLLQGILHQQEPSGRFRPFFYSERSSGSEYYPGQALLAIMTLYEKSGREELLEPVARALPYYAGYFERHPSPSFVPWQTRAYCKYYYAEPSAEVVDFVFRMNDFILANLVLGAADADPENAPGISTAVYVEGVNEAYQLACDVGDEARQESYADFIRKGCDLVMGLQCPMAGQSAEQFSKPAIGGFFGKRNDRMMRVDHNQHGVMALMRAHELGLVD